MKILFTGASSFTGYWFVRELTTAGHEVVMTFRNDVSGYKDVRRLRVEKVMKLGRSVHGCSFGGPRFMEVIAGESGWDQLCHHAADVTNYKSPEFDIGAALQNNTRNLRAVLEALKAKGCNDILLTGSVFEEGEGAGSDGLPAFSPYGVSKGLTARVFAYLVRNCGMNLGRFVIPNPFGPYEEPRFTAYLMRSWFEGKRPSVNTPDYVRDNIHVSLLAKAYADFAGALSAGPGCQKLTPSGYVESQGDFAQRFARNMHDRLGLPCELKLERQTEFPEPRVRIGIDPVNGGRLDWDEARAWDELAAYYQSSFTDEPEL